MRYFELKAFKEAVEHMQQAMTRSPSNPWLLGQLLASLRGLSAESPSESTSARILQASLQLAEAMPALGFGR